MRVVRIRTLVWTLNEADLVNVLCRFVVTCSVLHVNFQLLVSIIKLEYLIFQCEDCHGLPEGIIRSIYSPK
jgi:hypothetical protein